MINIIDVFDFVFDRIPKWKKNKYEIKQRDIMFIESLEPLYSNLNAHRNLTAKLVHRKKNPHISVEERYRFSDMVYTPRRDECMCK